MLAGMGFRGARAEKLRRDRVAFAIWRRYIN